MGNWSPIFEADEKIRQAKKLAATHQNEDYITLIATWLDSFHPEVQHQVCILLDMSAPQIRAHRETFIRQQEEANPDDDSASAGVAAERLERLVNTSLYRGNG